MYKDCCFTMIGGNEILVVWENGKLDNMKRIHNPNDIECIMDYSNMTPEQTNTVLNGGNVVAGLFDTAFEVLFNK